jgi:hypothetical protein
MRSAVSSFVNPARWWQTLLHNQRALMNQATRLFALDVIVAAAPHPHAVPLQREAGHGQAETPTGGMRT